MKLPESIKEDHSVIGCNPVRNGPPKIVGTATLNCELCQEFVYCTPVTIEKSKLPYFHIVCTNCYEELRQTGVEIVEMGGIKAGSTRLPNEA